MTTTITLERRDLVNETLPVSEPARREADELVERASGSTLSGFTLVIDGKDVPIGESLSQLLAHVVEGAANDGVFTVRSMPKEVSTTVAARELGISRPTLMKMIRADRIPSHSVGTHTRLMYSDVIAAVQRMHHERTLGFQRVLAASEALGER